MASGSLPAAPRSAPGGLLQREDAWRIPRRGPGMRGAYPGPTPAATTLGPGRVPSPKRQMSSRPEPPEMFDNHMSKKELETIAPRLIEENGKNFWIYEGQKIGNMGLNAVVGRPKEEYGMEPLHYDDMRKAIYSIDERIGDMNANGILSSMCFPTFPTFAGNLFHQAKDKNGAKRVIEAYNDWHIDEWAGKYPGRIIPLAMLPIWDPEAMVKEVKRVVAKGCKAITFPDNPSSHGFPSLHNKHWDRLWEVCAENDVVINCHIGTGAHPPHSSDETPIDAWITSFPLSIATSAADWLHGRFLLKYDNLKISLTEGGIGWVPIAHAMISTSSSCSSRSNQSSCSSFQLAPYLSRKPPIIKSASRVPRCHARKESRFKRIS